MRADQCFKKLLMDVRVLAKTLNVFIKNLDASPEDIVRMWEEGRIILMNSELVSSSSGRMTVDLLYKIETEKRGVGLPHNRRAALSPPGRRVFEKGHVVHIQGNRRPEGRKPLEGL